MSIYGIMRTSVSGMNAQANRLSAVSDNIANSNTNGYKKAYTDFSSMTLPQGASQYNSGVVDTRIRSRISEQGNLSYTTSTTDLAVNGNGFMVVSNSNGENFLTRAGSFVVSSDGSLVNAAGFKLMGYKLPVGDTVGVVNGFAGLEPVSLATSSLIATPTTEGKLAANLPDGAAAVPQLSSASFAAGIYNGAGLDTGDSLKFTLSVDGSTPAANITVPLTTVTGPVTLKDAIQTAIDGSSIGAGKVVVSVDAAGAITYTAVSTGPTSAINVGPVTADNTDADGSTTSVLGLDTVGGSDTGTNNRLPSANAANATYTNKKSIVTYDNVGNQVTLDIFMSKKSEDTWEVTVYNRADAPKAPSTAEFPYSKAALTSQTLTFDGAGKLASEKSMSIAIPGGQTMALDLSSMTQLGGDFQVLDASANGNPPSDVKDVQISANGIVSAVFTDGSTLALYKVPLANVASPDNLETLSGNVFAANNESGAVQIGFGGSGGLGDIVSGAVELSTVDLASELTEMIEAQRGYTANSKVFQSGSEILDVLVNLKR
ncbi:flagellar hook protein FlgE [Mangrovicella endophytica]|uniref:flagellar hook protein FlgE n=1 Tax=Mangrovicella endophytica TaxID=2066697 RepID=UPI000C9E080F|nr:flagellar hook protein FlgE [Mangrovicella endophytica]